MDEARELPSFRDRTSISHGPMSQRAPSMSQRAPSMSVHPPSMSLRADSIVERPESEEGDIPKVSKGFIKT